MSVTPQTNIDLDGVVSFLKEHDDFVICGHVSPDGDCIGSQLGLMHALHALGKNATCLLAKDEPIDLRLSFLPGADQLVPAPTFTGQARTFIAVDVPLRDRMNAAAGKVLDRCEASLTIDHHATDNRMTDFSYVDPDVAATTMFIWNIAGLLGVDRTEDIALCCYTGLVTDTGRFQYQNTDAPAFRAAAEMVEAGADAALVSRQIFQNRTLPSVMLEARAVERVKFGHEGVYALSWVEQSDFASTGAVKADSEPIIDVLRSLQGVRVACMLRDQGDSVRGSFRAKDDTDVASLARTFGGGGHRAAAGFTISGSVAKAVALVEALLSETLEESADEGDLTGERRA